MQNCECGRRNSVFIIPHSPFRVSRQAKFSTGVDRFGRVASSCLLVTMATMAVPEEFDPEEPVIDAVRRRDRHAFAELVGRQSRWIRGVVFGVLGDHERVDDVMQQVWSSIWERVGELRDTRRWRCWVYRLARNAAIDAGREVTRERNRSQPFRVDPMHRAVASSPEGALIANEDHRTVLRAIRALPALYREPFVLRHLNGWKYQEIGDLLGMPVDTVETRLVRARRLLRESLGNQGL